MTKILALTLAFIPALATAQGLSVMLENPIAYDTLGDLLLRLVDITLYVLYPIAVLFIIYSGFKFVTAGGNADQIDEAKKMFFWAVIGSAVLLGSKIILEIVQGTISDIVNF